MSSITHPVGPEEPRVYWRRRVALLLALLVVVALVAFALSRVGGSDAAAAPAQAQETGSAPAPSERAGTDAADPDAPADAPADAEPCAQEALQVVATADAGSYPEGTEPQLGAAVRNTGSEACTVDLAPGSVELLVVSGADRIWSSLDCLEDGADAEGADAEDAEGVEAEDAEAAEAQDASASDGVVTVAPGEDATLTRAWPRQRSQEGCPADQPAPRPGTYQLTATVAGSTSTALTFSLG